MEVYEFPDDLKKGEFLGDISPNSIGNFKWCEKMKRVKVELESGSMYPMVATHPDKPDTPYYSFMFNELQSRPTFLPRTAHILGCVPE